MLISKFEIAANISENVRTKLLFPVKIRQGCDFVDESGRTPHENPKFEEEC